MCNQIDYWFVRLPPKHNQKLFNVFHSFAVYLLNGKNRKIPTNKKTERKKEKNGTSKNHSLICGGDDEKKKNKRAKTNTKGKSWANNFNLQYDISLFESFILLFDINAEMRTLEQRWYVYVGLIVCSNGNMREPMERGTKSQANWIKTKGS